MYKIAIIYSSYPEMTEAAQELIRKKGYHIEVAKCVFEQAVQMAKKYEAEGFDLILSRGATGALLQKSVSIPVILVEITNFDILQTLYQAKKYGEKMAYFEYLHSASYHDFAAMREILQINEGDLVLYYYRNEEELRKQVADAFRSDVKVIVATGAFVLEMAKLHGMKTIMVHSTKEAIYNAFKQAEDILNIRGKAGANQKVLRQKGFVARYQFTDIVGTSEAILKVVRKAKSFGRTDSTVLITGESGTGKEIFANSIHNISSRRNGPFVAVNCATIPENLLESELFGYEEGAFTGAKKGGRAGLFEMADKGTIFLDEISEIPLATQAQLLRVLQEKVIRRVGGNKIIPVDVRVIAATNADLLRMIQDGQFRSDLYYRLNVLNLQIPPLRERKEDIPPLVEHCIQKCRKYGQEIKIPELFMAKLQNYPWPGNIRELENFVEKFIVLYENENDGFYLLEELYHDLFHFNQGFSNNSAPDAVTVEIDTLKNMELQIIKKLCAQPHLDKTALARKLGISRSNLWSKLKEIEKSSNS